MADLQLCYFCGGGPGDSIGEYAVVPPVFDPSEEQQQTVALCRECREKLTAVMEPVVGAAEAYVAAGEDGATTSRADVGEFEGRDTVSEDAPPDPGGENDSVPDATGDEAGGSVDFGASTGSEEVNVPSSEPPDGDDDEVAIDAPDEDANGGTGPGDQPGAGRTDEPRADGESEPVPGGARTPPNADDDLVGRDNEAYNKTLRLLQNREFPVERHDIEQVAANAYQLDPQEVSNAIDTLLQKGMLTQEGAHLKRP